jgi:hypothetical protein
LTFLIAEVADFSASQRQHTGHLAAVAGTGTSASVAGTGAAASVAGTGESASVAGTGAAASVAGTGAAASVAELLNPSRTAKLRCHSRAAVWFGASLPPSPRSQLADHLAASGTVFAWQTGMGSIPSTCYHPLLLHPPSAQQHAFVVLL